MHLELSPLSIVVTAAASRNFTSWQLRRVKSTVHLTGKPSAQTKELVVDLLAPSKAPAVATTAVASESRHSSCTDLATAAGRGGDGGGGGDIYHGGRAPCYRGELKEDGKDYRRERATERAAIDGRDPSALSEADSAFHRESAFGTPAAAASARRSASLKVYPVVYAP